MAPVWWLTKDGDLDCLEMYERHYSAYEYRDGRKRVLFVGPGEKWVFRTRDADAVWVWRKFIDDCIDQRTGERQQGVNCAVFRNNSPHLSSELVRQADSIADLLWPDSRHYTYVDPEEVASTNPGYCFRVAGWKRCGFTQGGLLVLERVAINTLREPMTEHGGTTDSRGQAVPTPGSFGGLENREEVIAKPSNYSQQESAATGER